MVDCLTWVRVFVTGGDSCILPCAGVGVCDFGGRGACVFCDGAALPLSAFGKYWSPGRWHRIENHMAVEEIKLFALCF